MGDYSCAPNCDTDSTYIDIHQRSTYDKRQKTRIRDPVHEKAMKKIRRRFICNKCNKYPGDHEWSLGTWDNGSYTCFDCT